MLKVLLIGSLLLSLFSCSTVPDITVPLNSCTTSFTFKEALCGQRNLDYKTGHAKVGEWIDSSKLVKISTINMPDMVCFSTEDWLTKLKPLLKEGADYWTNHNTPAQVNDPSQSP